MAVSLHSPQLLEGFQAGRFQWVTATLPPACSNKRFSSSSQRMAAGPRKQYGARGVKRQLFWGGSETLRLAPKTRRLSHGAACSISCRMHALSSGERIGATAPGRMRLGSGSFSDFAPGVASG